MTDELYFQVWYQEETRLFPKLPHYSKQQLYIFLSSKIYLCYAEFVLQNYAARHFPTFKNFCLNLHQFKVGKIGKLLRKHHRRKSLLLCCNSASLKRCSFASQVIASIQVCFYVDMLSCKYSIILTVVKRNN